MRVTARVLTGTAVAVLLLFATTVPALASEPELVDTRVQSVTGAEIARQIVSDVSDVELGSQGATITFDLDGEEHAINVGVGGQNGTVAGGVFGLAALTGVAAGIMRVVGRFGRLFH